MATTLGGNFAVCTAAFTPQCEHLQCQPPQTMKFTLLPLTVAAVITLAPQFSQAVPSFARQMNMSCTVCHTEYPILTEFGRQFKLNGYTMSANATDLPPLAIMAMPSFTHTAKGQAGGAAPHYADNDNFALNQLSVFYSGRLFGPYADSLFGPSTSAFLNKFGTFIQTTYDGVGKTWAWDNAELRWADTTTLGDKALTYGFYMNNNPGMQDPWNSTPAWGFPFSSSSLAPTPGASQLIDGGLAQQVLGIGGYAMLSNSLYVDIAAYHSAGYRFQKNLGIDPTGETEVPGLAPYWRTAYTHSVGNETFEIGVFGLSAATRPGRNGSKGKDHITDWGVDAEYQASFGRSDLTGLTSFIYEDQNWNASQALGNTANRSDHLWTFKATGDYLFDKTIGGAVSYFVANGSSDPLLYTSTAKGSPLSDGVVLQLNYMPIHKNGGPAFWPRSNVKFSLQYVAYNHFDGASRHAGDNNTLYLEAWFAF